jgi:hypothetical protein
MTAVAAPARWRTPEELVEIGLTRSPVLMANEAHNGLRRSVRTREIGIRIVAAANDLGARHLALEAMVRELAVVANETRTLPPWPGHGYLSQPDMRALVGAALDRGWTLHAYEAELDHRLDLDPRSMEATNWREDEQALNLARIVERLPAGEKLVVWCGNSHLSKLSMHGWTPMGVRFRERTGIDHFALDQTRYVVFERTRPAGGAPWIEADGAELDLHGGAAGFLTEEAPPGWSRSGEDAYLLAELDEIR